ncbi:MAG: hypothetical protein DRQ60_07930 [Gammaproteobacteria bacterium]|nr:MAG: hypothetical protein DRQ54_07830 [Gammaproteobacteria bacterium]RLA13074.1 MAG: hypothetical protein DRQ60_07930 [Gammaproteobacteria bacterium]RLA13419.1 MAG: hypothetical protein DRQ52_06290 [Gammaproteobacteria bacterium]
MLFSFLNSYRRSIATTALLALALAFAFSSLRINAWEAVLPLFEWMETSWFGVIGKTWGGAFAVVQAIHLLAMALSGGAILISNGRLLGLLLRDQPVQTILIKSHRLFVISLIIAIISGVFMACGVATKIIYLPVYWIKMLALTAGVLFTFTIKQPLLADGVENLNPWVVRAAAVASLTVWFTVAATGRWIGYSG